MNFLISFLNKTLSLNLLLELVFKATDKLNTYKFLRDSKIKYSFMFYTRLRRRRCRRNCYNSILGDFFADAIVYILPYSHTTLHRDMSKKTPEERAKLDYQ